MEKEHPFIWVQTNPYRKKIDADSILYCKAVHRKVEIYFYPEEKPKEIHQSLVQMEALLPADKFYRCNRWFIINLNHVDQYSERISEVILVNGEHVSVARNRKELFSKL